MSNLINITDKSPLINYTKKINGEKVVLKTYLSSKEYFGAIHTIADICFIENEDTNEVEYKPEFKELAWRYVVLKYFTDIEIDDINIDEIFKVTQSKWYAEIEFFCNQLPITSCIQRDANELIDYRLSLRKTEFDKLCNNISAILDEGNPQNLADIQKVLDDLNSVDKEAFVKAVTENVIAKTKGGEDDGGEIN